MLSQAGTGENQDSPLFLVTPLTLFTLTSCFPFLFIDLKGGCCPPCLLTLVFHPSLSATSFHRRPTPLLG